MASSATYESIVDCYYSPNNEDKLSNLMVKRSSTGNELKIKIVRSNFENLNIADSTKKIPTPKRKSVPPKKYEEYVSPPKTRKTLNFSENNTTPNKPKSNSRSKMSKTPTTPKSKSDLNNSFRTTILKSKCSLKFQKSPAKASPRTRRATKYYYYESASDSDSENVPVLGKRSIKKPSKYDSEVTPRKKIESDDDYIREEILKTPKSKRTLSKCNTPKSSVKKTPKNRAKLIRDGVITPSLQTRDKAVAGDSTPLMKARSQLHVSYVPTALPCRDKEYCDIYNFLEGKLLDGCGGCMYISGVPGTGKTATVTAVIKMLLANDDVPDFKYVSINGMKLTEPRQSYVEILKQIDGKTLPWEQAQSLLDERFTKSKKKSLPVVMLVDELDILCTRRQDVVYNLLDWPTKSKNQLVVITIANTMDLPERLLMSRVTSRLGLTRLTFQAYSHKELQEIVTKRLIGTDSFNPDAIQFVARKVASVSGDARRALDICRRAAELAESEHQEQQVGMQHVNEALNAMITQPKVRAIKRCSRLEQLVLQAVVAEIERTGVEETTYADMYKMLVTVSALDGFKMASSTNTLAAVSRLSASRLIITDSKCNDIYQRIILNVSVDDVYYALKRA